MKRLIPASLLGQVLLAIALALLTAQAFNGALLYRGQIERHDSALANTLAFRLLGPGGGNAMFDPPPALRDRPRRARGERRMAAQLHDENPIGADEPRAADIEDRLRRILRMQGYAPEDLQVVRRAIDDDPVALRSFAAGARRTGADPADVPETLLLAAVRESAGSQWRVVRVPEGPRIGPRTVAGIIIQTIILTLVLFGALFFVLRRITRPLAALTARTREFAAHPLETAAVDPSGPSDVRELIEAHNALEARIAGLLDEKDVMLGAIGHDLKTPLAALRVRIESVPDDRQRAKMAAGVSELDRMLDDILSLARIGRPVDAPERLDLAALVASLVEEYEDRGKPVTLDAPTRAVGAFRPTWIARAMRNLIDNALRYGGAAHVALVRDGDAAVLSIADEGPGIPEDRIAAMMEPFRRGEASRNRATGGSGLGLTLARAIAEQHGGTLELRNRTEGGLVARLRLPL